MGTIYEIKEPNLLEYIKQKLTGMAANGDLARAQNEMRAKTEKSVRNPLPVPGITHTTEAKSWIYDPSITVENDLKDQNGQIFHKAGEKVNPLDRIKLSKALIFIDGSDEKQMKWALAGDKSEKIHTKIILTNGPIIDLMKKHQIRLYFDQKGLLTGKFGITQVPAIVKQEGNLMRINEVVL